MTDPLLNDRCENEQTTSTHSSRSWMRYAGLGIELASFTLGCTAIGYFVDQWLGNATPIGTAFGTLIGFSFGMFRFIQRALNSNAIQANPTEVNSAETDSPWSDSNKRR